MRVSHGAITLPGSTGVDARLYSSSIPNACFNGPRYGS